MQERGSHGDGVEAQLGKDAGDCQRVGDVGLAVGA